MHRPAKRGGQRDEAEGSGTAVNWDDVELGQFPPGILAQRLGCKEQHVRIARARRGVDWERPSPANPVFVMVSQHVGVDETSRILSQTRETIIHWAQFGCPEDRIDEVCEILERLPTEDYGWEDSEAEEIHPWQIKKEHNF